MKAAPALLERVRAHAAAIDVGAEEFFVSVGPGEVASFGTFTRDLHRLCDYLKAHQIEAIAIDAAGVYWLPLYDVLEVAGFEVTVINGGQAKSLPGRKSDVLDCQWYQELFTYGLLRPCFIPDDQIRTLRSYVRLRDDHIRMAAAHVQHMQKALDLMNVRLHRVITQIQGASGMRIMTALLAGERDPEALANLCETQILRNKRAEVIASLEGTYRAEHLFALEQAISLWESYHTKIDECDEKIAALLEEMTRELDEPATVTPEKPVRHHKPKIENLHLMMQKLTAGNDLAQATGFSDVTIMKLISETGLDMTKWKTEKHFASWTTLAPGIDASGRRRRHRGRRGNHRVGQILRQCAQTLARSKHSALGAFYRRISARRGPKVAVVATARKLAVLYYRMIREGIEYVEQGVADYEAKQRERQLLALKRQARQFGLELVPQA